MRRLLPPLLLALTAARVLGAPPEALAVAVAHARTLPTDYKRQTRYLDVSHLRAGERADCIKALSFHLNSLSRESEIVQPRELPGGVLWFDLRDYGISKDVYLKLGTVDPYYHVKVSQDTGKYGYYPPAPWLDQGQIQELYDRTYSQVPILRGDWLLYQTAVQKDRRAGYYDLLGVGKKEVDFQKLIGADVAEAKRLKLEVAASVVSSGVTLNNRGITRLQALTGGYWRTLDFRGSADKQNTARLLSGDTDPAQGDASEQYGVLSNGLFAYWLQDGNGNRQDTAPDFIASDGRSTSPDRRVHVGLSCVRCHVEGLRPVDDYARRLFREPVFLRSPDYDKLKRLRQLYLTDLPAQLAADNARFAASVRLCNGLDVGENARVYAAVWEAYADTPVDAGRAAAELGCTEQQLLEKVRAYAANNAIIDPVMAALAQQPPLTVRREHLEETYSQFQKVMGRAP